MDANTKFDVASFMNESIDGVLDTALILIPEGEHMGQIGVGEKDVDLTFGISKKKDPPTPWLRVDIFIDATDPNLAVQLKREKVRARYSIMLDLNEEGKLDTRPQRNVHLGKLREAVGQNKPGLWNWNMLKGQPIKFKIKHKVLETGDTVSEVSGVTKAI
jgi:hypothetical protein